MDAAHHIVAYDSPKAEACRQILKTYGIAMNSPANGVFLPMEKNDYVKTESMHYGGHSDNYYKEVEKRLTTIIDDIEELDYSDSKIQQLLCNELQEIRSDLLTGELKIQS